MCGACGAPPRDPDGHLVAGPRRRTAVARALDAACPALTVRAVPGGWTVATRTGRTAVCRTLAALLDAVAADVTAPIGGTGPVDVVREMLAAGAPGRQPPAKGGSTSSVDAPDTDALRSRTATSSSR